MHSLYRSWLGLPRTPSNGPLPPPPPPPPIVAPPPLLAPDVVLSCGGQHFAAHRAIVAQHSGYLKAAMSTTSSNTSGSSTSDADNIVVQLPELAAETFAPLLAYMYTGFLDLNPSNIYSVLLATHLLHMPRAVDVCRSYLLHQHTARLTNVIKPIPSRKFLEPTVQAPLRMTSLPVTENSRFKAVHPGTSNIVRNPSPENRASSPIENNKVLLRSTSPSGSDSSVSDDGQYVDVVMEDDESSTEVIVENTNNENSKKNSSLCRSTSSSTSGMRNKPTNLTTNKNRDPKVIIDIACCDGPVRFHRVLNDNFGLPNSLPSANTAASEIYTCAYCKHSFKSQYCYQKHARRHLLGSGDPTTRSGSSSSEPSDTNESHSLIVSATTSGATSGSAGGSTNVQYYPCKRCGSKFPSYYFVHKHRRLCHGERPENDNNANNSTSSSTTPSNDTLENKI